MIPSFKQRFAVACLTLIATSAAAFGAEPVDWIARARYVVTMDAAHQVIGNGAIAVKGHDIVAIGPRSEVESRFTAAHTLDKPESVIAPGFIDTHTHAPMSLLRAIADDKRLDDWLNNYIFPAEKRNVTADFVRWGTRLACLEMVMAGITTYTDMYYFEDVEAQAAKEAGVRGVLGQTVIGFPSPDHKDWKEAIAFTDSYMKRWGHDDLITPTVAPHSIYTTPDEALVAAHQLAVKYHQPLLIHLAETRKERDDALAQRHLTPTAVLEKLGLLDGRLVAAHSVWESDADLEILKRHGTGVAHCPSSNTKLASGIARVTEMLRSGIPVGLGTDGFAGSNDTADLIGEISLASKLQKVTTGDPTVVPAEQALEMATIGGARILGLDRQIGSLEPGKKADFITISLAHANAHPLYNVFSIMAFAAKPGDVEDVFINGRPIVSNRRALTLDPDAIFRKAEEYRRQILLSLKH